MIISSQVQEHGLMPNLKEVRQDQKKRIVSDFIVDKRLCVNFPAWAVIAGTSYAFWDVLVPTTEEAVALTRKTLEKKGYLFRTEYMGRRRTTVSIYEIHSFLRNANLATFMLNFGDIDSASHDECAGSRGST